MLRVLEVELSEHRLIKISFHRNGLEVECCDLFSSGLVYTPNMKQPHTNFSSFFVMSPLSPGKQLEVFVTLSPISSPARHANASSGGYLAALGIDWSQSSRDILPLICSSALATPPSISM
jgi:hypothetical protein